jgi:16S rRNA C967 or C1407 C5-methylase (RsmB/RsmF family)/NOL1/NOP2/fmu family ribosome biogenesis protein
MNGAFECFLDSISSCSGFDREAMAVAQQGSIPVSVRMNPLRNKEANAVFGDLVTNQVPWCSAGSYLSKRPQFTLDPHLHAGTYYVQEASSMFISHAVEQVLGNGKGLRGLDLCAAPGGKSTLLASLPHFKLVVANELIASRVSVLQENITKWGASHVVVTHNDAADFSRLGPFFDFVLVDAPCSGSGLFRKDPSALNEWSPEAVSFCAQRQRRILSDTASLLDEDGILVYSTCSFSKAENEDNLDFLVSLGFESVRLALDPTWQVVESFSDKHLASGYRFYPDKISGEGFFCAVLRKVKPEVFSDKCAAVRLPKSVNTAEFAPWVNQRHELFLFEKEGDLFAIDDVNAADLFCLRSFLRVKKSGVRMGRLIRGELIPDHELALSALVSDNLQLFELDKENAIRFLRRDELQSPVTGKGWFLVAYEAVHLGWIKISQGRVKNNYPMNWRILMKP